MEAPDWWEWELEISSHCVKRMNERVFNEADLRAMLEDATGLVEQVHGTFLVETQRDGCPWEVIVSPDLNKQVLVVVTAYRNL
jgi:hypothetical protein